MDDVIVDNVLKLFNGLSPLALIGVIVFFGLRALNKISDNQKMSATNQGELIKVVSQQDAAYNRLNSSIEANTEATKAQTSAVEAGGRLTSTAANEITKTGDRVQQLADAVMSMSADTQAALNTYSEQIPKKVYENSSKLASEILTAVQPIPEQIQALSGKLDTHARELANARGVIEQAPEAITVMVTARLASIIGTTQQQLEQLNKDVQVFAKPAVEQAIES
jgi:hypothetical protein